MVLSPGFLLFPFFNSLLNLIGRELIPLRIESNFHKWGRIIGVIKVLPCRNHVPDSRIETSDGFLTHLLWFEGLGEVLRGLFLGAGLVLACRGVVVVEFHLTAVVLLVLATGCGGT